MVIFWLPSIFLNQTLFFKITTLALEQWYDCPNTSEVIQKNHYSDVIMSALASQITSFTIFYSTVYSGADQRKHQSSAFVCVGWGVGGGGVGVGGGGVGVWGVGGGGGGGNSPMTGGVPTQRSVRWRMSPFDDVIIYRWYWPTLDVLRN